MAGGRRGGNQRRAVPYEDGDAGARGGRAVSLPETAPMQIPARAASRGGQPATAHKPTW